MSKNEAAVDPVCNFVMKLKLYLYLKDVCKLKHL